jgi:hypothetical protein
LLSAGSIVDTTIIHAPPSTKNQRNERVPQMISTKKVKNWHFGMKAHIGVDVNNVVGELIREDDRAVFGDKGYTSDKTKRRHGKSLSSGRCWTRRNRAVNFPVHSAIATKNMPSSGQKSNTSSESSSAPVRLPQGTSPGLDHERGIVASKMRQTW